jgi:hypothetical protein
MADAFGTMGSTSATTDPYDGFGAQFGYYTDHETGLYSAPSVIMTQIPEDGSTVIPLVMTAALIYMLT